MPLFIFFFLISMSAFSKTHFLLIDAGTSSSSGSVQLYNNVKLGYKVARSSGFKTKVIAKDAQRGSDKFLSYPPIDGQFRDTKSIVTGVKSLKPEKDDSVLIYIVGHGKSPYQSGNPSTAVISTRNNDFTYGELAEVISKLPKTIKIKIVSQMSFSGGVHHIARTLTNVCTAATVGYENDSISHPNEYYFNKGFWNQLKEKGKNTSFAEMSIAGFQEDENNINMGNLSSWDYVDFILKKGAYENFWPNWLAPIVYKKPFNFFNKTKQQRVVFSTSVFPPAEKMHVQSSTQACKTGCDTDSILSNLAELNNLTEILKRIELKSLEQSLRDKTNALPKQPQSIFHDVLEDMKKNGKTYAKIASDYDRQYKDLQNDWITTHLQKSKKEVASMRAQFQAKVDALQKQAKSDLSRYAFNSQMLDRLNRLDEFSRVATAEQKQKFMQLLNCEWEPI